MKKAIKITPENKEYIATRFELYDDHVEDLLGLYVICDFANDYDYSFIDEAALERLFVRVEPDKYPLLNGFFPLERK